jgi:glycosyltransferase involved in cell wall biosynthesis
MTLTISIGILAYNEARLIGKTLKALFQQSLFSSQIDAAIEVVVVPNGCTDATAEVARKELETLVAQAANSSVSYKICDIAKPGKSNAWNRYVHEFSVRTADYLMLMDADIQFVDNTTLHQLVEALNQAPDAWVSVDIPIKHTALKKTKNPLDRLSASAAQELGAATAGGIPTICGQLYCGRAAALRELWMPVGLPVEDGFLRGTIVTDGFTAPDGSVPRIIQVPSASHVFEAYTDLGSLLRHEKRLVIGNVINAILFGYLWANCNEQQSVGALIKQNNERDPNWLHHLVQSTLAGQGWWVIPHVFTFRRFLSLRHRPIHQKILRLPIAIPAFLADLIVCIQANSVLRNQGGLGYWGERQASFSLFNWRSLMMFARGRA